MKKLIILASILLMTACVTTPSSISFDGEEVGTYKLSAGCKTLQLSQDCSELSGATKNIEIEGTALRISGSDDGSIIFIMSSHKFIPDEQEISDGAKKLKSYLADSNVKVLETKVMYGNDVLFGVHYTLNQDGYTLLQDLSKQ